jgi:hypothetical protein
LNYFLQESMHVVHGNSYLLIEMIYPECGSFSFKLNTEV